MQKLVNTFKSPGLHILQFFFFFALLGWPLLTIIEKAGNGTIFFYTFVVWGLIIFFLFLVALSLGSGDKEKARSAGSER